MDVEERNDGRGPVDRTGQDRWSHGGQVSPGPHHRPRATLSPACDIYLLERSKTETYTALMHHCV